jgi:hypothetical protein
MKYDLKELKETFSYLEAETNASNVEVSIVDNKLIFRTFDRKDSEVEITLYPESGIDSSASRMATLKKSNRLVEWKNK